MNRLVIIGNGFDLAHGLKTSYKDFIRWYLNDLFDEQFQFGNGIFNISNCLFEISNVAFDSISLKYDIDKPWLFMSKLIDSIRISKSLKKMQLISRILHNIDSKGWTDIESDYYALLKDNADNLEACKRLNDQMDFLRDKLSEYLSTLKFINKIKGIVPILNCNIEKDDVALSSMKMFEKEVSSYEHNIYRPCGVGIVDKTMVLDFNYTDTILNYISASIHNQIHGSLNHPNSIIFGYGDEMDKDFEQLEYKNENELLKNSKSIKYIETDHYRQLLEFLEEDIFQVYIMGHSCGNSDRTLLHTIFEHRNCISIKPFYYKWGEGENEDTYSDITRNIYRNFKDKTLFRDRVVNKKQCRTLPQASK